MPKNTHKTVTARKAEIARLHLEGFSGQAIAAKLAISESQVSRDLGAVCERWRELAHQDIAAKKALDLAELSHIKRELWSAWHLSPKKKRDPRFLTEIMRALKQVSELLGYNATQKIALNYENLSDEQLNLIIESIINNHETNKSES